MKHLRSLQVFAVGYDLIDVDSTVLHNLSEIIEYEASSYSQQPTFYFVLNPKTEEIERLIDSPKVVLYLLRAFGYKIDLSYFNQMERSNEISGNEFLIKYWTEKVKLIDQIREQNDYSSIIVIDDDNVICSMLRKLDFEVYQTKITRRNLNQTLPISFTHLNSFLTTKSQSSFERRQNRELIVKGVVA